MRPPTKHPCRECPFRIGGPVGWTGAAAPEEFAASILNDERMPCHRSIDYEDPQWHDRWVAGKTGRLCAGSLTMAANLCKRSRDPQRPAHEADRERVYATLPAMIDAHRAASVHSWRTSDTADVVVEVRERLRMAPLTPATPECAYLGCREPVGDDDHCAGCDHHVCERHSTNYSLMGRHDVTEHWTEESDED
jgi:hypothetical protein